jgi:hypothetical protein
VQAALLILCAVRRRDIVARPLSTARALADARRVTGSATREVVICEGSRIR